MRGGGQGVESLPQFTLQVTKERIVKASQDVRQMSSWFCITSGLPWIVFLNLNPTATTALHVQASGALNLLFLKLALPTVQLLISDSTELKPTVHGPGIGEVMNC